MSSTHKYVAIYFILFIRSKLTNNVSGDMKVPCLKQNNNNKNTLQKCLILLFSVTETDKCG